MQASANMREVWTTQKSACRTQDNAPLVAGKLWYAMANNAATIHVHGPPSSIERGSEHKSDLCRPRQNVGCAQCACHIPKRNVHDRYACPVDRMHSGVRSEHQHASMIRPAGRVTDRHAPQRVRSARGTDRTCVCLHKSTYPFFLRFA